MFCMLACTALFYSCGTDDEVSGDGSVDPDKEIPDPTGTIQIAMRNSNNGKTVLGSVYIDNENFAGGYFASLGPVRGLGNVAHIPTTGWGRQVSVIPGHGYVAYDRYEEKFYRIYVIKDLVGVSGGIIGSEIKYQAPFKGNDEKIMLDSTDLRFPFTGGQKDIVFKNSGVILFDVETDVPNWCTVQKTSTYDDSFLTNGVRIIVKAGSSKEVEHGTITLTTLYGKKTVINITRSGIEPFVSFGNLEERELSAAAQTDQIEFVGNMIIVQRLPVRIAYYKFHILDSLRIHGVYGIASSASYTYDLYYGFCTWFPTLGNYYIVAIIIHIMPGYPG